ncbi:MATE family efflux transporter [Rathayibacter toxicus]|uniref:MATE family efflux transporter n=1 Tax=Rathayibacter toxicus TaxID=145458 RepID=UPI000CE86C05|nr:MATE family efflux transporter [Rathayibacter toxicus]PPI55351.1 MATE family efflux transporter [Rathayibacter toxicus]QOD11317.1 MATE family efflux transporter [Rathayibacter toxicus]QWL28059.1 MATE family efflux transporter [Rathayibacter toxicus]QWL32258.1 MATE family efflux transporter [Rathayibacter toxicus]QWL34351.1 MATE family efflux transporter [Rathayibacter toxicus]
MISSIRQLLALGGPLAIGFVSQMAISFTDTALVARMSADALAGTTLALSVFSLVMLMGLGIVTAVAPKVADSFRRSDTYELGRWFTQGLWLSLVIGALSVAILFNTGGLLRLLGQSERIASIAQEYNSGAAVGVIFFYLYVNIRGLLSAVGDPKPLTWIMLAAVPANFFLASLLIFGVGSFGGFGVFGAGIGSTVIRVLVILASTALILRSRRFRPLGLGSIALRPELSRITHLLRIGVPIGFRILVGEGFPSVVAFMIAAYGAEAVAAHAVGIRLDTLISVLALGISSAATTVAAWYRADADRKELSNLRASVAIIGAGYVFALSAVVYFSYGFVLSDIFGISEDSVIALSWQLLPLVLLSFAFGTWGAMYNGLLVGLLDTTMQTIVVTASYWIIGLIGGHILSSLLEVGFMGYWIGMIAASAIVAGFNYLRVGYLISRVPMAVRSVEGGE